MKTELKNEYHKMRKHKPFMMYGRDAECSLHAARTVLRFRELQADGLVRIRSEYDPDPYDFGNMDLTQAENDEILSMGVFGVITEVYEGCPHCGHGEWVQADSIWGNAGYNDPGSEYENCYVVDLMQTAIGMVDTQ